MLGLQSRLHSCFHPQMIFRERSEGGSRWERLRLRGVSLGLAAGPVVAAGHGCSLESIQEVRVEPWRESPPRNGRVSRGSWRSSLCQNASLAPLSTSLDPLWSWDFGKERSSWSEFSMCHLHLRTLFWMKSMFCGGMEKEKL